MYSSSNSEVTEPTYTPSQFSQLFSCLTSTMPSPTEPPGPRGTNAINNISDTNKDKGAPNPNPSCSGTDPILFSLPLSAEFEHAGVLSTTPGEALPGTFMITDEHRRDDDNDEDQDEDDEILFMRSTPNSSHASSLRVGTMSRSRYSMLGTTQPDGKDESHSDSDSDSDSDGGAPLFTPSRDKTLGDSSREETRAKRFDGSDLGCPAQLVDRHQQEFQHGHWANSNTKADALNIHHHRPKTLLASFRPGMQLPLGIRTEPDPDAHPAYFSTRFIVKRAVARLQARRLNRLSSLDHSGRIESLIDGEQQTNDIEQQTNDVEQHHINGRGTYYNPPASPLPTQASKPLTTTTTTRKPNYSRPPTETSTTENPTPSSVQLGPFTLSPSDVALLASSEASFKRLTTPKFHPAFSGSSGSRRSSHRVSRLIQDSAEEWMDLSLDVGAKLGPKKKKMKEEEEEEEDKEEWEWVDHPMGRNRGYA
ncbi:uncharacterized protein B0T23DRAFT_442164 [Neurospora hispaniola]|uniref:Uncharacterized protein n=1 Tax=Neurospora hispaniola TaxID=588809 RepID=A0AAJ0MRD6_9PEZI|nr:hypothetical protein B0T23DRAFT_442164 [Neurospora hispaniola]